MNTELFIRRPVLALVLSFVVMLLGLVSIGRLGIQETPDIESPVVTVSTAYFGADPAIVESEVTEVLEREINGIEGLRTLSSTSREQASQITVEFDLATDLEAAANDVRDRVARARGGLPPDVEEPIVEKADADGRAVMYLRLVGERTLLELSEIADVLVRERLETVPGVSRVDIYGERRYAMRVELDPVRLAARGLTALDVAAALEDRNVNAPAGRIEGATTDVAARVDAGLTTPEAFGELVVAAPGGVLVRLGELGQVRLGAEDERSAARSDGVPSVSVAIMPQAQANVIAISEEVRRRIGSIRGDLPADVNLQINYDRSIPVRASIRDVVLTLLLSALTVVVVIWGFLRDARATLVPAAAIVVSLVGTFTAWWALGFTINVFTLFGLVLAIGIVVDDAIVVLENIWRHLELGEAPLDAAVRGTAEMVFPVIATTLALIAVFLPVVFAGGPSGRLFYEFGTTVAVAVALSTFVALTLTPTLCARLLRPRAAREEEGALERGFGRVLAPVVARPWLAAVAVLASLGAGAWGLATAPTDFFPLEDRNFFLVRLTGPEGAGFAWMDERVRELEPAVMEAVPERTAMLTRVNTGRGGLPGSANSAFFAIPLVPSAERDRSQDQIVAGLRPVVGAAAAFRAIPIQLPTIGRGFGSPLQLVLQADDQDALAAALPGFLQAAAATEGLTGVDADLKLDRPEARVVIDRDKAAALGVSVRDLARSLQILSTGLEVDRFQRGSRQYPVMVGLREGDRMTAADLEGVRVRGASGALIPVGTLVRFEEASAPSSRYHYDRAPSATISANPDGIPLGTAIERLQGVADDVLPAGFRTALAGQAKDFAESSSSLTLVFGLALALVFLVLAGQFDSFRDPLPILVSLPVGVAGGLGTLALAGEALSFFAQVGLVLLIGLVTKNGILIVEFASQLAADGRDPWSAASEAARLRLRPILMTAVSTVGGAVPIALGLSGSSRSALGLVVVGGMVASTVLSLLVTPVVWAALRSLRVRGRAAVAATVVLLLVPGAARSEELTLEAVLAAVLADAPAVRAATADAEAARLGVGAALGAALPTLGADGRFQFGNTFVAGGAGVGGALVPFASVGAQLDVPVFALSSWGAIAAARADRTQGAEGAQAEVLDAVVTAVVAWLDLVRAQSAVTLLEDTVARSTALSAAAQDRLDVGAGTRLDVVRADLQIRRDELALLEARRGLRASRARLAAALGRDDATSLSAPAPQRLALPTDAAPAIPPEVRAADAAADAARARVGATGTQLAPRVNLFGAAGALSRFSGDGWLPTVALGLTAVFTPVDGAVIGRLRQARSEAAAAAARAEVALRAARSRQLAAAAALETATAALGVAEAARALADEELALAEDRYRLGAGDNLAVIDAQVRRVEAVLAELDAVIAYDRAVLEVARSRGDLSGLAAR